MSKRSPRLQFSDEERASPELKKVIEKADKKADKLDKAEAKIPKKTVKRKERVVGEDGKVSVKLHFEEVDKKKPTSKLTHSLTDAPLNTVLATAHREVRDSEEDNVGVEGAHKLEQVAEGGVRTLDSAHRSHKLKPYREAAYAEKAADKANLKALNKQAQQNADEKKAKKKLDDEIEKIRGEKGVPNVIIKGTDEGSYENLIACLNEMQICDIGKYVIVAIEDFDKEMIEYYKTNGTNPAAGAATE